MAKTFVSAQAISDHLFDRLGVRIDVARITELAEAGYVPHARCDGGPPIFRKKETTDWVLRNLIVEQDVRTFPTQLSVYDAGTGVGNPTSIPAQLAPMADCLREIPISAYRPLRGVYFLVRASRVVYVGMTDDLPGRIRTHLGEKQFDRLLFLPVPHGELGPVETAFVRALKPELNQSATQLREPEAYDPIDVVGRFIAAAREEGVGDMTGLEGLPFRAGDRVRVISCHPSMDGRIGVVRRAYAVGDAGAWCKVGLDGERTEWATFPCHQLCAEPGRE